METGTTQARTTGGVSAGGIGVLVVWLLGYFGVAMTAEIGAVVGGLALGAGVAIGQHGLIPCFRMIMYGPPVIRRRRPPDSD